MSGRAAPWTAARRRRPPPSAGELSDMQGHHREALVEHFHTFRADLRDHRPIFTKTDPNHSASPSPI
ncbi:hypothetical protein GQ457_03G000190 [Hibiscus cannabinus]